MRLSFLTLAILIGLPSTIHGLGFPHPSFGSGSASDLPEPSGSTLILSGGSDPRRSEPAPIELHFPQFPVRAFGWMEEPPDDPLAEIRPDHGLEGSMTRLRLDPEIRPYESGEWAQRVIEILFSKEWDQPDAVSGAYRRSLASDSSRSTPRSSGFPGSLPPALGLSEAGQTHGNRNASSGRRSWFRATSELRSGRSGELAFDSHLPALQPILASERDALSRAGSRGGDDARSSRSIEAKLQSRWAPE